VLLGASQLAQKKYVQAEAHLLQGYQGLQKQDVTTRAWERRRLEALEHVVRLYEAWDKREKAEEWRGKLKAMRAILK
jgi:hypothetical protein